MIEGYFYVFAMGEIRKITLFHILCIKDCNRFEAIYGQMKFDLTLLREQKLEARPEGVKIIWLFIGVCGLLVKKHFWQGERC